MTFISTLRVIALLGAGLLSLSLFADEQGSLRASASHAIHHVDNFMDDSTVTARVKAALIDNQSVDNNDISVRTENRTVTLTGFVMSEQEKQKVLKTTASTEGVLKVCDHLHIQKTTPDSFGELANDVSITSKIKARLMAHEGLSSRHISVKTTNGTVLLSGDVASRGEVNEAIQIAHTQHGVKQVKNDLVAK